MNKLLRVNSRAGSMRMSKYNWVSLKEGFMASEFMSPVEYLEKELGVFAPGRKTISKNAKGWKEEKKTYIDEINGRVRERVENIRIQYQLEQMEKMLDTKNELIKLVQEYFKEGNAYEYVYYKDPETGEQKKRMKLLISSVEFKNMWQIIKAEVGEPITIPAENVKGKDRLEMPKDGVFGIKQLMVKWKAKNGQVKQISGTENIIEGETVTETETK